MRVRFVAVVLFSIFIAAFPNETTSDFVLTHEADGGAASASSSSSVLKSEDDDRHGHSLSTLLTDADTDINVNVKLDMQIITIDAANSSDIGSSTPTTTNSTTTPAVSPPSPSPVSGTTTTSSVPTTLTPQRTTTFPPTKKYEPDDEERKEEEKEEQNKKREPSIGMIFIWTIVTFGLLWMSCYFSDAILFFLGNVWINTRRYGCRRGCLQPMCPCIFGSSTQGLNGSSGVAATTTLDEIIFESEDSRTPLIT